MKEIPLEKVFMLIEPGNVAMISTFDGTKNNLMTLSWLMPMDFTPRIAFLTGAWNHSYDALVKTGECVISIPSAEIIRKVVKVGGCSGADTDKFEKFKFTPLPAKFVKAPLVKECFANIECRLVDHVKKHDIFVFDAVAAWKSFNRKPTDLIHAVGNGKFLTSGKIVNLKSIMPKAPDISDI